jgi:hypothetical protein
VTAVGVAAVTALEMISSGKDEIRTFVIKVFTPEIACSGLWGVVRGRICGEFGWFLHC